MHFFIIGNSSNQSAPLWQRATESFGNLRVATRAGAKRVFNRNMRFSLPNALALLLGFILFHTPLYAEPIAILGATIIDGNGGKPVPDGVVVIDGERIVAVGDTNTPYPDNARIISAKGKYIIPGLMDSNVHLVLGLSGQYMVNFESKFEDIIIEAAQLRLRYGVTTMFDTWGPLDPLKKVRDDINQGKVIGSRIYTGGNIVGLDGPLGPDFYADTQGLSASFVQKINAMWQQGVGRELMLMTPDQVRSRIREYLGKDIDFFKYAVSGHGDNNTGFLLFSPKVHQILIDEARNAGLSVQSHTTSVESLRLALEANVDLAQHCTETLAEVIPPSTIDLLIKRNIPCSFNVITHRVFSAALGEQVASDPKDVDDPAKKSMVVNKLNQRNLVKAGATILLSTDGGIPYLESPVVKDFLAGYSFNSVEDLPAFSPEGHFTWLQAVAEIGMSPMDLLQSATINIAKAYRLDKDLGTVEAGKIADILILDDNPLADVSHYRSLFRVIKQGKIIDIDALPINKVLSQ